MRWIHDDLDEQASCFHKVKLPRKKFADYFSNFTPKVLRICQEHLVIDEA
jgi:hypothetical protein